MKRQKEEVEEFQKREKGGDDYFNMRDVAILPKYNFEKLPRKLTILDFY